MFVLKLNLVPVWMKKFFIFTCTLLYLVLIMSFNWPICEYLSISKSIKNLLPCMYASYIFPNKSAISNTVYLPNNQKYKHSPKIIVDVYTNNLNKEWKGFRKLESVVHIRVDQKNHRKVVFMGRLKRRGDNFQLHFCSNVYRNWEKYILLQFCLS